MGRNIKKSLSVILVFALIVTVSIILPTSVGATSYRESIINAVLKYENIWYDKEIINFDVGNAFVEFKDINYDGRLEFIFGYNLGTGRNDGRVVYYYTGGKLIKAKGGDVNQWGGPSYYEDYTVYYDKNSGKIKNLGTSSDRATIADWISGNYEMTSNGKSIEIDYYSACKHSGYDYDNGFTYYAGAKCRGDIGNASKITEQKYNSINNSKTKNSIELRSNKVRISMKNWDNYATSAKKQKLMQSYDGFSLSSPNLSTPKLTTADVTYSGIKVNWNKVSGVKKYRVFRKNSAGKWEKLADTTGNSFADKTVKNGKQYTYTVRGIAVNGTLFVTGCDKTGITAKYLKSPEISKIENRLNGANLTWNKINGAAMYRIFVKTSAGWLKLADKITSTSYVHTKAVGGKKYTYTVCALNSSGKAITGFNPTGVKNLFIAAPAVPKLKNTKNGVHITWKKSVGAEKYRIYRKIGNGEWKKLYDTSLLSYTDRSVKKNTTYSYSVRCISSNGKTLTSGFNNKGSEIKFK